MNQNLTRIVEPLVYANNFELKLALINMVQLNQFARGPYEDANLNLACFLELCDTVKFNGMSDEIVKLRLFPFFLWD